MGIQIKSSRHPQASEDDEKGEASGLEETFPPTDLTGAEAETSQMITRPRFQDESMEAKPYCLVFVKGRGRQELVQQIGTFMPDWAQKCLAMYWVR